jgi:predicted dithiol-disulfide oxidoreductase (DUF899 family)
MEKPKIVTAEEWQQARDELLVAEKEATRARRARRAPPPSPDGQVRQRYGLRMGSRLHRSLTISRVRTGR